MSLKPLHKHSGRLKKTWKIGRLLVMIKIAEDPSRPLILRTWGRLDSKTDTVYTTIFGVNMVTHEYGDDGSIQKAMNIILGPVSLWLAIIS